MRLDHLRELAHTPGPFASVYLDTSHNAPHADHLVGTVWRDLRSQLGSDGADERTLAALDERLAAIADGPEVPSGRAGRVLVAADGRVLLDQQLDSPPERPRARWSPLPDLLGLVTATPEPVPTVVVVVDAAGADIYTDDLDNDGAGGVKQVTGPARPLHQVRGGGLSHLRMRQTVREHRHHNIKAVADAVDKEVAENGAALLVLAGEVQSRTWLHETLGERAKGIAVEVEGGGRAEGTDDDKLAAELRSLQESAVNDRRRRALQHFAQVAGQPDGLGVEGLPAVLAAFRAAMVDTLVLDAGVRRDRPVWVGPEPEQVADDERTLRNLGLEPAGPVDADAALIRAVAGTGAELYLVGGDRTGLVGRPMIDGIGAVLRGPLPT